MKVINWETSLLRLQQMQHRCNSIWAKVGDEGAFLLSVTMANRGTGNTWADIIIYWTKTSSLIGTRMGRREMPSTAKQETCQAYDSRGKDQEKKGVQSWPWFRQSWPSQGSHKVSIHMPHGHQTCISEGGTLTWIVQYCLPSFLPSAHVYKP